MNNVLSDHIVTTEIFCFYQVALIYFPCNFLVHIPNNSENKINWLSSVKQWFTGEVKALFLSVDENNRNGNLLEFRALFILSSLKYL